MSGFHGRSIEDELSKFEAEIGQTPRVVPANGARTNPFILAANTYSQAQKSIYTYRNPNPFIPNQVLNKQCAIPPPPKPPRFATFGNIPPPPQPPAFATAITDEKTAIHAPAQMKYASNPRINFKPNTTQVEDKDNNTTTSFKEAPKIILSATPQLYTVPRIIGGSSVSSSSAAATKVAPAVTPPSKKQHIGVKQQTSAFSIKSTPATGNNKTLTKAAAPKESNQKGLKKKAKGKGGETMEKQKKEKKPKKMLRVSGGHTWEDATLKEWEDGDFRMFAGDLGNDVTDELLSRTFSKYPSFLKARVIRDKRTNKTKGYGFISFKDPQDFIRASKEMNGRYVGSRPIKLIQSNWKNRNLDVVKKKEREKAALISLITKQR